jgi:serine/threonine-protein kinase RsbW
MSAEHDNLTERLKLHATSGSGGVILASAPGAGCTTLLRQTTDQIFSDASETIPIYFSIEPTDGNAVVAARRFAHIFLSQVVAFRRHDANLVYSGIGLAEITRLSAPEDIVWIDRAVERISQNGVAGGTAFIERCLSIPLLGPSAGFKPFIIFDGLHDLLNIENGEPFFVAIKRAVSRYNFAFILAGRRRFVSSIGGFERLDLDRFPVAAAAELAGTIAAKHAVDIEDSSRDLIAIQLSGRPAFIEAIIKRNGDLSNFPAVERAYTEELFAGEIGRYFDRLFDSAVTREMQAEPVSLLADSLATGSRLCPVSSWQNALGMDASEFERMFKILDVAEVVRVTSNRVQPMAEDVALSDYLNIRNRLETLGEDRAAVYAASLAASIRRAPQLMAAHYRANSAIGLCDVMEKFDGRQVPLALLDHTLFKERYQGKSPDEITNDLGSDVETVKLPAAVFAAHTEAFYPPIAAAVERERSAVAVGFQQGTYTPEDEIYWLAAEIDSKLDANRELAEFWCDRLETVAKACGFENYRFWLIAPTGFDAEAAEVLSQRNAFSSSRSQAELLAAMLDGEKPLEIAGTEYEIVIPMGDETELVAAHTLEEIAKRHGFKSHDINQIKTALVEACINAAEHSHSPDGRTNLKFTVRPNSLNITVANRGLRLTDAAKPAADSPRRGWGLKLIEKLMDDVRIDQTDDGTRISMTKLLQGEA